MKNTQKVLGPIVIVIILAVLLGGGYVAYTQYAKEYDYDGVHYKNGEPVGPASNVSTKNLETQLSNLAKSASDTKDWKTYRNGQFDFQFQYPSDAVVEGTAMPNGRTMFSFVSVATASKAVLNVYPGRQKQKLVDDLKIAIGKEVSVSSVSFLKDSAVKIVIARTDPSVNAIHVIYETEEYTYDFLGSDTVLFETFYRSFELL